MSAESTRLFFALWPEPSVRRAMEQLQRVWNARARPVPAERLHITLAFLGQVTPAQQRKAGELAGRFSLPRCTLCFDRLGVFPRAKVGWIGPGRVPGPLAAFVHELRSGLNQAGVRCDTRAWKPHVTLYRDLRTPAPTMDFDAVEWPVRGFRLVRSLRRDGQLRYEPVSRWPSDGDSGMD